MSRDGQCQVEGCARRAKVDVYLDGLELNQDLRVGEEVLEALRVCLVHGGALGTPQDLAELDEPPCLAVTVEPEKAAGWRLVVMVRPSGRHAVCLFPPDPV